MSPKRPALSYALTLLGRRDYSTWEMERKLEGKGYQRDEIMTAVARLRNGIISMMRPISGVRSTSTWWRRKAGPISASGYAWPDWTRSWSRTGLICTTRWTKNGSMFSFGGKSALGDRNLHPMKSGRSFSGPVACMLLVFPSRKFGPTWTIIRSLDSFFPKRYN